MEDSPITNMIHPRSAPSKPRESGDGYFDIDKEPHPNQEHTRTLSEQAETPMPLLEPQEGSETSLTTSSFHFLLVEDNPINMKILETYMQKLHCTFDAATNSQQAVNAYRGANGGYRCILIDISMPVMDGFEATRQIRGLEKERSHTRCYIFAISGLAWEDVQKEAFATSLDLFLSKPVHLKKLS
jgi:CheY-like chemotaxis protein